MLDSAGSWSVQFSRPTCPGLSYNHRCSSSPPKWHQGSAWACVRHLYRREQRWQRKIWMREQDAGGTLSRSPRPVTLGVWGTEIRWNIRHRKELFLDSLLFSSFLIERPVQYIRGLNFGSLLLQTPQFIARNAIVIWIRTYKLGNEKP